MPPSRWLLAGVPVALGVGYLTHERHVLVFVTSVLAILLAATMGRATEVLGCSTGWSPTSMPRTVSATARELGMTELFVGVIVVALAGNAAEHFSAVSLAARNQMDAAIAIAVGSSTQIALFVAPVLVLLSYVIAPRPMDLRFTTFELVAIGLSVLAIAFIAHDGETLWMEGVQLLAVYAVLALGFFFLPG